MYNFIGQEKDFAESMKPNTSSLEGEDLNVKCSPGKSAFAVYTGF